VDERQAEDGDLGGAALGWCSLSPPFSSSYNGASRCPLTSGHGPGHDVRKQLPIADVDVTAENALGRSTAKSDSSGYFTIKLLVGIRMTDCHSPLPAPDYQPLDSRNLPATNLYCHLTALSRTARSGQSAAGAGGNVRVRYSIKNMTAVNIGSAVKTFQIENSGNVPARGNTLFAGWQMEAAIGTSSSTPAWETSSVMPGSRALPAPVFTKIESDAFPRRTDHYRRGPQLVRHATFLLEAECFTPWPARSSTNLIR